VYKRLLPGGMVKLELVLEPDEADLVLRAVERAREDPAAGPEGWSCDNNGWRTGRVFPPLRERYDAWPATAVWRAPAGAAAAFRPRCGGP
jgi:hypothetical protein